MVHNRISNNNFIMPITHTVNTRAHSFPSHARYLISHNKNSQLV